MKTVPILGVRISRLGLSAAVEECLKRQASGGAGGSGVAGLGGYVCFANAHSLTEASSDPGVRKALNESFLSVADGVPVVWTSRLKGAPIETRVCGPDFMKCLIERSAASAHGFIGGAPGQAEKVAAYFGLSVGLSAICYSPPMRPFSRENALEDWQTFLKLCPGGAAPPFVWIGLGAPKQELWMNAVSGERGPAGAGGVLFFGVGAAFDFWAGDVKRAPVWMQNNGLEWLFRFGQEPGRLWKRYLVGNTRFVGQVAREVLRRRRA